MPADISIIITAKDRLWSLPKAVESGRSSSLKMQIIVVDDNSKDGTWDWLQQQRDLTSIKGEGWGQAWAINKAMPLATGKYLRFLDSDDWLNPGASELQFEIAERERADVTVSGADAYHDDVLIKRVPWVLTDDFIAQQLGESDGSHYSSFLFRREFITDLPHRCNFPAYDFAARLDRCFILEVALRHPKISECPTPALCHRHHGKGRLQFRGGVRGVGTNIQHLLIYRQILNLLDQRGELTERRKKAAVKILWPLAHWIAYSHLDEACEVADWVFKLDPEFQIPEQGILGRLYRGIGFRRTEQVLALRRALLRPFNKSA